MLHLLLLFLFLTKSQPVLAIATTPTVSAIPTVTTTVTPTPTDATTNLDEIQKIRKAVQEKVKEKLQEIVDTQNKKIGLIGTVISIDNATIIINHLDAEKTVITDENTVLVDVNRKRIDTSKLKVGQSLLVMGYQNQDGAIEAKRIVVNDPSYLPVKKVITIGKIVDRSLSSNVAVLIPSNNKNNQYQIVLTDKTLVSSALSNKVTLKDVTTGKKVIVVLTTNAKTKSLTAESVYIAE